MKLYKTQVLPVPPTFIGWGSLAEINTILKGHNAQSILVIADPALITLKVINPLLQLLDKDGISYTIYSDLIPEPTVESAQKAIDFGRKNAYDLVIGFGGGSALDITKLVAVFTKNPGPIAEYLNLNSMRTIEEKGIPKILIPTTSGTGTEVTNISVLSLPSTKDVVVHNYLLADAAIVDPALTASLPPKVTAATGADALTHAIEAFISVNANPYSDGLALQAIRLISSSLKEAVSNGNNKEARSQLAYGSYIAGMAFFNAGVGAVHALAYPLGGQFHLAHGDSNAVLLPYVLKYIQNSCSKKLAEILHAIDNSPINTSENEAAEKCIELLAQLMADIGIPLNLDDFGIPPAAAKDLAADAVFQKRLLARCPATLEEKDILFIYRSAFKNK